MAPTLALGDRAGRGMSAGSPQGLVEAAGRSHIEDVGWPAGGSVEIEPARVGVQFHVDPLAGGRKLEWTEATTKSSVAKTSLRVVQRSVGQDVHGPPGGSCYR